MSGGEIPANSMDPTHDAAAAAAPVSPESPWVALDADTQKLFAALADLTRQRIEFSTRCNPTDSQSKLTELIARCLDVNPAAFNTDVKGRIAFFKVSPESNAFVISRFVNKAKIVNDEKFGQYLEARIDVDDGHYYKFRISNSVGGIGQVFNAGRGRADGGRGRGGRGGGRGRGGRS